MVRGIYAERKRLATVALLGPLHERKRRFKDNISDSDGRVGRSTLCSELEKRYAHPLS